MEDTNGGTTAELSKIVIGGQEYDPTEAQELLNVGRQTREMETKYNTTFDKVWPSFGEKSNQLAETSKQLEQAQARLAEFEQKSNAGVETPTDVSQALEDARKLGIITKQDLEGAGYIRAEDLTAKFEELYQQKEAIKDIYSTADKLESEINGTDGRPAFNKKVVLAYAAQYKIPDLQDAYNDMHADALKRWQDAKVASQKPSGLSTLSGNTGNKEPKEVKVTRDNLLESISEKLHPNG